MNGLFIPTDVKVSINVPKTDPFEDASYYDKGLIATLTRGKRKVDVEVGGDVRMYNTTTGDELWHTEQVRSTFPDGKFPDWSEDWDVQESRWFEFFLVEGDTEIGCLEGEVEHDYTTAMNAAIKLLFEEEDWV